MLRFRALAQRARGPCVITDDGMLKRPNASDAAAAMCDGMKDIGKKNAGRGFRTRQSMAND